MELEEEINREKQMLLEEFERRKKVDLSFLFYTLFIALYFILYFMLYFFKYF